MMRIVRKIGIAGTATLLCGLVGVTNASAKVATCDEIAAAQGRGLTSDAIREELNTTAARIENCARLAEREAQHSSRKSEARARRNARMVSRGITADAQ